MTSPNTPVDVEASKDMGSSSAERAALLAPQANCPEAPSVAGWRDYIARERRIRAYQFREAMIFAHVLDGAPMPPGVTLGGATYHRERREVSSWRASVFTMHDQRVYLSDGDWIVPEPVADRFYPVKPEAFEASYERAPPAENGADDGEAVGPSPLSEATDELTLSRLLAERREMLEALKDVSLAFTLAHVAQGIDPDGSESLKRARAAILSAVPEGKGEP